MPDEIVFLVFTSTVAVNEHRVRHHAQHQQAPRPQMAGSTGWARV